MKKQLSANIKLGFFVMVALLVLVFSLYMIGRNKSFFGSNFEIKAQFKNVNGLMRGNNIRFSGIQAGTVKDISILNDTTIEVTLLIDKHTQKYIHKNSFISIGSEGLMGNKIINIEPNSIPAPVIEEGDMLLTAKGASMDDMLQTLDKTNNNAALISADLVLTIQRINNSKMIWNLLNDTSISENIRASLINIQKASDRANAVAADIDNLVADVHSGRGAIGLLLRDTLTAGNLKRGIEQINYASYNVNATLLKLDSLVASGDRALNSGEGIVPALLHDSAAKTKLYNSLDHIEKGTAAFSEDMEALKHNFLLRGYFKKESKRNKNK